MPLRVIGSKPSDWSLCPVFHHRGLHIEHHGIAWMICNSDGMNVAGMRDGVVLFAVEREAEATLAHFLAGDAVKADADNRGSG